MKIGVMANAFPKFSKTFVLDQIVGMIERGHDVSVFAPQPADEPTRQSEVREYDLLDRTTYFAPPDPVPVALLGAVANTLALTAQSPSSARAILGVAQRDGVQNAGSFTYRARPIVEADLDVLHAHFGPIGQQAVPFKRTGACDALVTSFHGWGIREAEEHGGGIYEDLFECCDCVLANTDYTREKLLEFGADPKRTRTHHVGIDLEKFAPPTRKSESSPTTVLTVARLEAVKGIEDGISAFAELSNRLQSTGVRYRIVGDGPLRDALKKRINEHGLGETITLCGAMDQSDVVEEMRAADIFLLPSVHEGFGRVLVEAQATGLPIVVSDVGGVREAVSPDESASLVPSGDVGAMADALGDLIEAPARRTEMGSAGRRYAHDNFDIARLNDRLESIYAELV